MTFYHCSGFPAKGPMTVLVQKNYYDSSLLFLDSLAQNAQIQKCFL